MAYRDTVLTDTPIDYYEMSTGTGTDSGSGSRTLTLSGGITTGVAGIIGNGWSFDGVNAVASMGTWPTLTNAFTFEAWVKAPSAQGMTTDYPTVIRRDGTDIFILRVRGSALAVNPGQAEVYADGLTLLSGTSYRVDDGNWHHLVYTQAGNAAKLYVDGVLRASGTTTQSTFNMGTGTAYIGGGNTAANAPTELFKGVMDEVAVYNVALSATRVTAHYDAAFVNGGYTGQAMTASAAMPGGTGPWTEQTVNLTIDSYTDSTSPASNFGSSTSLDGQVDKRIYLKLPAATVDPGDEVKGGVLWLYGNIISTGSYTANVYTVDADWTEFGITHTNRPTVTLIGTVTYPKNPGWVSIDISNHVDSPYGFAIDASGSFHSSDYATNKPYIAYYIGDQPVAVVDINAEPVLASATAVDATVDATDTVSVGSAALTASALFPDATVSTETFIDVSLTAEPMDAYATWPTVTGFALQVNTNGEPLVASAEIVDATVETQRGPVIAAAPMTAAAVWKQPALVNDAPIVANESEDDYFQKVMADLPAVWLRLNDQGSTAANRMTGLGGTYVGVQTGQHNAPNGRHSVYFDGTAYIEQGETNLSNVDESLGYGTSYPRSTLEFSFRTSQANTFLMAGKDDSAGSIGTTPTSPKELYLEDGKLTFIGHNFNMQTGTYHGSVKQKGFRNLADGQWHSVVIKGQEADPKYGEERGYEVWIDGTMEFRRVETVMNFFGFPDFIGSRPDTIDQFFIGALPSSKNFVGDMSEIVFYSRLLSDHSIPRHYYAFMGWTPIEAQPLEAFAFTPADSRGKGNQKRALVLKWFDNTEDMYSIGGDGGNGRMNHNALLGVGSDFNGYKLFWRDVQDNNGRIYRDPVTDTPSLINLEHDVDIEDYDVIMFADWPDEGWEFDIVNSSYPGSYERLVEQLRWANNKGIGLFVTHPRLAVDLGVVDRVEYVPTLRESAVVAGQGNAAGLYDYGSAVKFPWNITASAGLEGHLGTGSSYNGQPMNTDPAFLEVKAYFYGDTNKNDRFRVRAVIEGLTDIPSYMIKDAIYHKDYDVWGWQSVAYKYLHRMDGLQIGDEYMFHGPDFGMDYDGASADFTDAKVGRWRGYLAAPLANVKAGTVVTTFGAKHWKGKTEVDNPYKDYATTIVLRPGDTLKGKPVGGKIYVNFTEQPSRQSEAVAVQVLPENNADFPPEYTPDTPAQREWEWSETRKTLRNSGNVSSTTVNVVLPNGTTLQYSTTAGNTLSMTRSSNLFPLAWYPSLQMNRRGLLWLMDAPEVDENAVVVGDAAITATASMPNPTVVAEKDADATAQPMTVLTYMPKVAEDVSGDVEIVTLPITAHAEFTGFSNVISATPMSADAELVENFNMVHASGEQVVLTLHNVDLVTLYLKEEA